MKTIVLAMVVAFPIIGQLSFPSSKLTPYIGSYIAPGTESTWILVEGDHLVMTNAAGTIRTLTAVAANTYTAPGNIRVEFGTDARGQVSRLIMRTADGTRVADKYREVSNALQNYVGVYQLSGGFVFTITLEGDLLSAQGTGQTKIPMWPESKNRFLVNEPGKSAVALLEFDTDTNGRARRVTIQQDGAQDSGIRQ